MIHHRPAQANPSGPRPVFTSPTTLIVFKSITATESRSFNVVNTRVPSGERSNPSELPRFTPVAAF